MSFEARSIPWIRLRTPAAWVDLDLDPATRAASIAAVVEERAVGERERVRAMLEVAAGDAVGQGAVFASLFSDTVGGKAVSASLVVSVVDAEPDDGTEGGSPEGGGVSSTDADALQEVRLAIAEDLAAEFQEGGADSEVWALEAGPATRVRSRIAVEDGRAETTVDLLQYFVPFPGADRLAVLSFSTPNVSLGDAFAEVFDAIASTLQWPS